MSTLEKLENFLSSNRVEVRRKAVTMLGEIKSAKGLPYLLDALQDDDDIVRAIAVFSLGEIGAIEAVDALLPLLQDANANTRSATAIALGKYTAKRHHGTQGSPMRS